MARPAPSMISTRILMVEASLTTASPRNSSSMTTRHYYYPQWSQLRCRDCLSAHGKYRRYCGFHRLDRQVQWFHACTSAPIDEYLAYPIQCSISGGLTRYVVDFEQAYALQDQLELTLAQEENRAPVLDSQTQRREKLINCLYAEPSMRLTVRICLAANYSFDRMIEFLGNEAFAVNHYDQVEATQRAQPRRANAAITSNTMQQFFEAMLVANLPKELVLPEQLYQCIPNEARIEFNKARNRLARESEKSDESAKPAATGGLPKQYTARANMVTQEEDRTQATDDMNTEEANDSSIPPADFISMLSQYNEQQQNHQMDRDFFMADVTWDVPTLPSMVIDTSHNLTMSLGDNQFLIMVPTHV